MHYSKLFFPFLALAFATHLCKMYLIDDRSNAHIIEADLFGTIEALQKIATHSPRPPDGMVHLMEMIKMSSERLEQSLAMSGKICTMSRLTIERGERIIQRNTTVKSWVLE